MYAIFTEYNELILTIFVSVEISILSSRLLLFCILTGKRRFNWRKIILSSLDILVNHEITLIKLANHIFYVSLSIIHLLFCLRYHLVYVSGNLYKTTLNSNHISSRTYFPSSSFYQGGIVDMIGVVF